MSTGESIVEDYFSSYEAYDLDIDAPSWINSRAGLNDQIALTIVGFKDVSAVEWQVHDFKDQTTEVGTASFHAEAQLARTDDDDKTIVGAVEVPFQTGGRVELGNESFETDKPDKFELQ
jgi:hypothetical protein